MLKQKIKAFTLVELIVVITILAILWTIAFISLQWYSINARDSVRISDLSNIEKSLEITFTKAWKVLIPEDKVDITASWTVLSYQWYAWKQTLQKLWIVWKWKDPLDETYYTYLTNQNLTKYQLMWFLENWDEINMLLKTYAATWKANYPYTKWAELWIILDPVTKKPIQEFWTEVDIVNTNESLSLYLNNSSSWKVTWTWYTLTEKIINNWIIKLDNELLTKLYIQNNNLAKYDDTLIWYWDMETTFNSWSTQYLKDLSYNWGDNWKLNWWISVWWSSWIYGKSTLFDWSNDYVDLWKFFNWNIETFTLSFYVKLNSINQRTTCPWDPNKFTPFLSSRNLYHLWTNEQGFRFWINNNCNWTTNWQNAVKNINKYYTINFDSLNYVNFTNKYVNNDWYYVVSTFNKWIVDLYLNWIKVSSNNYTWISSSMKDWESNLWIWKTWVNWWFLNWYLDELRIYNRALSVTEMQKLYNSN